MPLIKDCDMPSTRIQPSRASKNHNTGGWVDIGPIPLSSLARQHSLLMLPSVL